MALAALFANRAANPGAPPHVAIPRSPPKQVKPLAPKPQAASYIETQNALKEAVVLSVDSKLVIIAFVVPFAPPCDEVLRYLQNLQKSLGNLEVFKVDCCSAKGSILADAHSIEATPTLRFYVGDKQVHTMTTISQDLIHPFVVKWSKKAQR
jgi:hypothetical protein